ncbi:MULTISPECIES: ornithine cyclodeaminase family protein [unclassified Streptomyces]|uniref:ornithine cyclodeaminase family protein n=1 Tax=unclassified Streptomyces TaxID=2593676 RepID=UPI0033B16015
MLVLGRSQVESLLDMDSLIDALASAMADFSAGRASVPDRVAAQVPARDGFLAAMPGFLPSAGVLMTKLVSLFPHNDGARLPTHQALIVAFDPDTGEPAAVLDGTAITAARTGACSALSARLLAREDATVLAVLGTGVQARSHARAICRVRPIRLIRVAGRDPAKAAALADELSEVLETEVRAVSSYAEALDGADIAAATTHAVEPVIRRPWLTPGVHITSVGYNPAGREIDDATEDTVSKPRPQGPGTGEGPMQKPVPRDLPDQQAAPDEDPLDVVGVPGQSAESRPTGAERSGAEGEAEEPDTEVPDTDESGTGRRGAPHSGSPRPEQPVPDEPSA